ncbi:hypothetical protein [Thermohalobaculum sediminis]|uniref:hypothetical protein n=1 Tax=Thermohalobaculum sediminis TaxID=2939436 RepID=UPI0020BD7032|nr:hypothetical protein [Limibaculum sediminis]
MDTTGITGRRCRACADESTEVRSTLRHARRIFASLARELEAETRRLRKRAREGAPDDGETDRKAEERLKIVADLANRTQKAWQTVNEIEVKLMKAAEADVPGRTVIDLEAARAEIARRLDRLAA